MSKIVFILLTALLLSNMPSKEKKDVVENFQPERYSEGYINEFENIDSIQDKTTNRKSILTLTGGDLQISLNNKGLINSLIDITTSVDYLSRNPNTPSYLLSISEYNSTVKENQILNPLKLSVLKKVTGLTLVMLKYSSGSTVTIELHHNKEYIRMAVLAINSKKGIETIHWGRYVTSMDGPIAEYLGLNRSDNFTIGMISLDPNTDGIGFAHTYSAGILGNDSYLHLISVDRSKKKQVLVSENPILATPIPNVTVIGSSVALFGCKPAKELDVIEQIELSENLPHPMLFGQWVKRSPRANESGIWMHYDQSTLDLALQLTEQAGLKQLFDGNPGPTWGNWGHFDPNLKAYPLGMESIIDCVNKATAKGIRLSMYTLTNFIRSRGMDEPFIAPIPDKRLQTILPSTTLKEKLSISDSVIVLEGGFETLAAGSIKTKVLRLGDELVKYESVKKRGNQVILDNCVRGYYGTTATNHETGVTAARMVYYDDPYYCFYPGTDDMNVEVATKIAEVAAAVNLKLVVLDGLEGTYYTGHDSYSQNTFAKIIYDTYQGDDINYLSSTMSNYTWHIFTNQSWGEGEYHKGFRGSMLNYRIWRQQQLKNNLLSNKMGQYYPDKTTTVEDIEWLMARCAGYDAGVDFHIKKGFLKNPQYDRILQKIRHWEHARISGFFSEQDKMQLRQTDCLFSLDSADSGQFNLRFQKRWRSDLKLIIEPSTEAPAKVISGEASVEPCSIDFSWTHDPGIDKKVCISDDLIHFGGTTISVFEVKTPWKLRKPLTYIVRVNSKEECGVKNISIRINGSENILPNNLSLEPGQYIAVPDAVPMLYIYNENHKVIKEFPLRKLYKWEDNKVLRILIHCEPIDSKVKVALRVNPIYNDGDWFSMIE